MHTITLGPKMAEYSNYLTNTHLNKTFLYSIYNHLAFSGPRLPKPVMGHSVVEYGESLFLIGGQNVDEEFNSIYSINCEIRICSWSKLSQELSVGRASMIAAIIPDSMTNC